MARKTRHSGKKIARMALYYDAQPKLAPLMPPGQAETNEKLLMQMGVLRPWHLSVYRSRWFTGLADWSDRVIAPGIVVHMGLRKRFVDDEVRLGLEAGARQVLVLGAGLDTLAIRLAQQFPDAVFVEIDLVGTMGAKCAATVETGLASPNLHQVGADLGEAPLGEVLAAVPAWQPGARSMVVAEGLLMYLDEEDVIALLDTLVEQVGPGSAFVFSWLARDEDGRFLLDALTRRSLQALGEKLRWGVRPDELAPLLDAHGWKLVEDPKRTDIHVRYLVGTELAETPRVKSEKLAVAERV